MKTFLAILMRTVLEALLAKVEKKLENLANLMSKSWRTETEKIKV